MSAITSPNMSLPIPTVGNQPGPDYAENINSALTLIDSHDHTPGNGVQITPAGLNINQDLNMGSNSLTSVKGILFESQAASPGLQGLYVAPGTESPLTQDLWFTDGNGVDVQITSGGTVNAIIANIPGESYAAGTFFWKQGAGSTVPANFDIGSVVIRPTIAATAFGVRLNPPTGIASQYDINLPALPAATSFLTITNAGVMTATIPTASGITQSNLANNSVGNAQIIDGSVTSSKLDSTVRRLKSQLFSSSGSFVVPAGTTGLIIEVCGGGGGGGGGGNSNGTGRGSGGGGGGAGVLPYIIAVQTTPGETLTVTVGAGGTAGAGGAASPSSISGGPGGTGGTTSVTGGFGTISSLGGVGGSGGVASGGTPNAGGAGVASSWAPQRQSVASGSGGQGSQSDTGATGGAAGAASAYAAGGAAGAPGSGGGEGSGGGGGGGGAGKGVGGEGGHGARADNVSITPGAVGGLSAGGGGGGGATNTGSNVAGANGGAGGSGYALICYVD